MKLLKEEFKLNDVLKDFLRRDDIREALDNGDFKYIYEQLEIIERPPYMLVPKFTELMLKLGENPLNYMDYMPNRFLIYSDVESFDIPSGITYIGNDAFYSCSSLTSVAIPSSVTSIGDYAFESCSSLTSIVIPESVTDIGDFAFCDCSNLTKITFADNSQLTDIGAEAFSRCENLVDIEIPPKVTHIEADILSECEKLKRVKMPKRFKNWNKSYVLGWSKNAVIEYY